MSPAEIRARRRRRRSAMRAFLKGEAFAGLVLMGAAALGLVVANSALADVYVDTLHAYLGPLSVLHWINDGLMALFFLLVGLEVKRELVDGQLSTWSRRVLPGLAAVGGMAAPAAIYVAFNWGNPQTLHGWAAPAATDIAFTLGVLALLGKRVPVSLKIFVTALAIIDDLGAVAIIAVFYSEGLSLPWLGGAAAILAALVALNRFKVMALWPYLALGVGLWACVLQSGVHATLAGVALAFTIPLIPAPAAPDDAKSPLHRLEHGLHPLVGFAIIPLFGFANAGVPLMGADILALLMTPVALGVAGGLFLGKQLGIFAFTWATVKLRLADCPEDATWLQVYGVSVLCGIGFTMSLFIGLLAFPGQPALQDEVKLGVLAGSLASALLGAAVLATTSRSITAKRNADTRFSDLRPTRRGAASPRGG
ncbi:Na+/H+ antiporter NhaA [Phenylobacterium sp.]|uniref:Na+/H+ antiporter NhaA n=1 Tax=Phenylobacterium sp. TaxID=1871053 RepID=UPI002C291861|nr:Na+/H+ antiporter NhaA [Phenylobacterium sp.]HVI31247.1 Na+/H+ antiporter NhaA [Phenylobacterium sp.]